MVSYVRLRGAGKAKVWRIVFLAGSNLIAATCSDRIVRLYDRATQNGEPRSLFREHNAFIAGPIQLENDLVVSVDVKGILLLWNPLTLEVTGRLTSQDIGQLRAICKYDNATVIVGCKDGSLVFVSHNAGRSPQVKRESKNLLDSKVLDIALLNGRMVVGTFSGEAKVFDGEELNNVFSHKHRGPVQFVKMNENYIITCAKHAGTEEAPCSITVFRNTEGFFIDHEFFTDHRYIGSPTMLGGGNEMFLLPTSNKSIELYSITKEKRMSVHGKLKRPLLSLAVINDSTVVVSGTKGYMEILSENLKSRIRAAVEGFVP